jgi:glycosyltransferase involved in cell wall biosynthesis
MRILFLSAYFVPEIGSGPHLAYEFARTLTEWGHHVTVVTGFPRYNLPEMPVEYRGGLTREESMGGVRVLRIKAPNNYGGSTLSRGLVQILAPPVYGLRGRMLPPFDVVYTVTPPVLMGGAARMAARSGRIPWVASVQDLFPQSMVDLGVLTHPGLIRLFEDMERKLYRRADRITVMSEGNRSHVVSRGARAEHVSVVPNWVDTEAIRPAPRGNAFRAEHGLADRFVVLFAGTMGSSQGISVVVDAARLLSDDQSVRFVLVGDGVDKRVLQDRAAGLTNVQFIPMLPQERYAEALHACDVGLVTLRPEVQTPTVPSKIPTIMAAGRPIAASMPLAGDAPQLISAAGAGLVTNAGDAGGLAQSVRALAADRARAAEMGMSGRAYVEAHLSRQACVRRAEAVLRSAIEGGRR